MSVESRVEVRIKTEPPPLFKMLEYRRRTPAAVFGSSVYLYRVKE